ncbi:MAG TPA: type II toxin-antitoxin system HicB family antitoxin [Fimbriimonadaceae bacterium]|nr:type II toxin-antitoxin system HicB family antitoxin [Fimbriimonadaceae bacterium]
MLNAYIAAALRRAKYEILGDGTFFAEVPGLDGVFANADNLESCREQLTSVLEGWVLLGVSLGHEIPPIDGNQILVRKSA